eukprot:3346562-Amphidinium_carterae.2
MLVGQLPFQASWTSRNHQARDALNGKSLIAHPCSLQLIVVEPKRRSRPKEVIDHRWIRGHRGQSRAGARADASVLGPHTLQPTLRYPKLVSLLSIRVL